MGMAPGPVVSPTFGTWLREELQRRRWSGAELGRVMGVGRNTVNRWVHDEVTPDPASCVALAEALSLDVIEVLSAAGYLPSGEGREDLLALVRMLPDERLDDARLFLRFLLAQRPHEGGYPVPFRQRGQDTGGSDV